MIAFLLVCGSLAADLDAGAGRPEVIGAGRYQFGLTSAARLGLDERTELTLPGLATFVAPGFLIERVVHDGGGTALSATAGFSIPAPGIGLLEGTVLSSDPNSVVGMGAVATAAATGGWSSDFIRIGFTTEVRVGGLSAPSTLDDTGLAWLDTWLAPMVHGPTPRLVLRADVGDFRRWTLSGQTSASFVPGRGMDWHGRAMGEVAVGEHLGLAAGWAAAATNTGGRRVLMGSPLVDVRVRGKLP